MKGGPTGIIGEIPLVVSTATIKSIKITQGIKLPIPGIPYGQDFGSISMTIKGADITVEDIEHFKKQVVEEHRKNLEESLTGDSKGIVEDLVNKKLDDSLKELEFKLELARKFYKMCKDKFGDSCPEFPTR
jgi:hypothetical protein